MAGLIIIGVYCLFWWSCWKLAGLISNPSSKSSKIRKVIVFLIVSAAPYYYYIYEQSLYNSACDSVKVFFPENKINAPESLINNSRLKENRTNTYFGWFDYVISPSNKVDIDFNKGIVQFQDFDVYPREQIVSSNLEWNKKSIISEARYGIFSDNELFSEYVSIRRTFIYDFIENKKISSYSQVSYSRELHSLKYFLFPFSFKHCYYQNSNYENFNFNYKTLFIETFRNLEGAN